MREACFAKEDYSFMSSSTFYVYPAVTTGPHDTSWTALYDVLRRRGLSLVVVTDCIDTLSVAKMLFARSVINKGEMSALLAADNPLSSHIRHWLVDLMVMKPHCSQEEFISALLQHQPYLLALSQNYWAGPERELFLVTATSIFFFYEAVGRVENTISFSCASAVGIMHYYI